MRNEGNLPLFSLTVVMAFLAANSASAQTPADIAESWGLLGRWAAQCDKPPSRANTFYGYRREATSLRYIIESGSGDPLSPYAQTAIDSAKLLPEGLIETRMRFGKSAEVFTTQIAKSADGRIRVMMHRGSLRGFSIQDGKILDPAFGPPKGSSPMLARCGS
jgi:hypothetical protein